MVLLLLSCGGLTPERGRRLQRHRSCGGGVEGGNGNFKFLLCRLHRLPGLPSWFSVRLWYRYFPPRGQTAPEGNSHDGGVFTHNLPGTSQSV